MGFIDMDNIKSFIFEKEQVEEDKFSNCLKKVGLNIKSQLNFGQFVDIIRNQKLYNYGNGNNVNGEE